MRTRGLPEVAGVLILVGFWLSSGGLRLLFALAVVGVLGLFVIMAHPRFIVDGLAVVLGLVPFGALGPLPLLYVFILGTWVVVAVHPRVERRSRTLNSWVAGLMFTSLVSVILVRVGPADYPEFVKWLVATSVFFPLLMLPTRQILRFGQVFTIAAAGASIVGSLVATVDKGQVSMKLFNVFGYRGAVVQYVFGSDATETERLSGTYLNPNAAGIFLLVAITLAVALFRGRSRAILVGILAIGLALALSRAAFGGLAVAALLIIVFHPADFSRRARTIAALASAAVGSLMIPSVAQRLADSFGSSDAGTQARGEALSYFPTAMHGHWAFGLGWGRTEFFDANIAQTVNYVANSPLLTIYRGGILTGIAFIGVLVCACIVSGRSVVTRSWTAAIIGASFIGFTLVTLQLDFPVVTIQPLSALFSVFLVFVARSGELGELLDDVRTDTSEELTHAS